MTVVTPRWDIVVAGWIMYALYYVGRVNFSVAAPEMESELGFSAGSVGAMSAGFFWAYSLSGVPAGWLADRIGARWLVAVGLVGSGLMNLAFVASGALAVALVAWTANGVFQAMGWSPLVGGLRRWVPEERVTRVSAAFGSSFVAGTAITFAGGGLLVGRTSVFTLFVVAAAILVGSGLVWWILARGDKPAAAPDANTPRPSVGWAGMTMLVPVAAIGVAYVVLLVWTPTYFVDVHDLSVTSAGLLSALMLGLAVGVTLLGSRAFSGRGEASAYVMTAALLLATAVALVLVPLAGNVGSGFVLVALSWGLVSAASSVLLGLFPGLLQAARAASVSGVFALAFNLGGGAGAAISGRLIDRDAWDGLFVFLAACVFAGAAWTGVRSARVVFAGGAT